MSPAARPPISTVLDPRGPITGSVFGLARLVAESHAFRGRFGATNWPAALNRVHRWAYRETPRILQAERPFAVVYPADELTLSRFSTAAGGFRQQGGAILILTDADKHPEGDREASGDDFAAWVDQILLDIRDRAAVDDRLVLSEPSLLQAPLHSRDEDDRAQGAYWDVVFLMRWGV